MLSLGRPPPLLLSTLLLSLLYSAQASTKVGPEVLAVPLATFKSVKPPRGFVYDYTVAGNLRIQGKESGTLKYSSTTGQSALTSKFLDRDCFPLDPHNSVYPRRQRLWDEWRRIHGETSAQGYSGTYTDFGDSTLGEFLTISKDKTALLRLKNKVEIHFSFNPAASTEKSSPPKNWIEGGWVYYDDPNHGEFYCLGDDSRVIVTTTSSDPKYLRLAQDGKRQPMDMFATQSISYFSRMDEEHPSHNPYLQRLPDDSRWMQKDINRLIISLGKLKEDYPIVATCGNITKYVEFEVIPALCPDRQISFFSQEVGKYILIVFSKGVVSSAYIVADNAADGPSPLHHSLARKRHTFSVKIPIPSLLTEKL